MKQTNVWAIEEAKEIFPTWSFTRLFSDWKNAIQNRLTVIRRLITHHCQTHNVQKPVFQNYGSEIVAAITLTCHSIKLKPLKPRCSDQDKPKIKLMKRAYWCNQIPVQRKMSEPSCAYVISTSEYWRLDWSPVLHIIDAGARTCAVIPCLTPKSLRSGIP